MKHTILLAAAVLSLGACALTPNGPQHRLDVTQAQPIRVDQQTMALRVPVDGTRRGLGRADLAALDAFVSAYRTRGHGPLTVTAPVGSVSDRAAQEAAARVREGLHAAGIPYADMMGASVRTGSADEVVVSFQSYVATGPACGRNADAFIRRQRGLTTADFGCFAQANLAAMVADPRDLHANGPSDGAGDEKLSEAITQRRDTPTEIIRYEIED